MNPFVVGGLLAGGKLTKALTQGYVGDLTDRLGGKHRFIALGALLYALGALCIPLAEQAAVVFPEVTVQLPAVGDAPSGALLLPPAFFVLAGAYMICGVADSIRLPASMALFVEEGERFDAVAGSMSLRSVAWKVGQVIGPVTVGIVWDATDVTTAFAIAAALITGATSLFLVMYSDAKRAPRPTPGD
jgi:MFS family permease